LNKKEDAKNKKEERDQRETADRKSISVHEGQAAKRTVSKIPTGKFKLKKREAVETRRGPTKASESTRMSAFRKSKVYGNINIAKNEETPTSVKRWSRRRREETRKDRKQHNVKMEEEKNRNPGSRGTL